MNKVKNILFKIELEGQGIVNYDGKDQKQVWNQYFKQFGGQYISENNVSLGKKNFYLDGDKVNYKIKISDQCLRNKIFDYIQSPNIMHHKQLLLSLVASPSSVLRGYTYPIPKDLGVSIKRSSVLSLTDAEQTNDSKSFIEFFARSGAKREKLSSDSNQDTSIYSKENVGKIVYSSFGAIDLMQMQFVSCSELFDRMAFDPDMFEMYSKLMKKQLPTFNSELKYYTIKNSVTNLPERGFVFSNEDMLVMTKWLLKQIYKLSIRRTNAYVEVSKLKIKLVSNPLENKLNDEEGWIDLNEESIDKLDFKVEDFYEVFDEQKANEILKEIEENYKKADKLVVDKKQAKAAEQQEKKAKREAKKNKEESSEI